MMWTILRTFSTFWCCDRVVDGGQIGAVANEPAWVGLNTRNDELAAKWGCRSQRQGEREVQVRRVMREWKTKQVRYGYRRSEATMETGRRVCCTGSLCGGVATRDRYLAWPAEAR